MTDPLSLNPANLPFAEELYAAFLQDPNSVPVEWQQYFSALPVRAEKLKPAFRSRSIFQRRDANGSEADAPAINGHGTNGHSATHGNGHGNGHAVPSVAAFAPAPTRKGVSQASAADAVDMLTAVRQDRVDQLIRAFRVRGHMIAKVDPLGLQRRSHPELEPEYYGLSDAELDQRFSSRTISGSEVMTLRQILELLRNTYCRSIGVEFMHIHDIEAKNWLQERMESSENRLQISVDRQRRILTLLTDAVNLEEFIQRKYLGKKSFSLEGAESLVPLLHLAIERAAEHGVDEITMGMAHRGRLNVLANILGKNPREIFREFEDVDPQLHRGRGDVKYHLGYSSDFTTLSGKTVHLSLCFNPSHLEYVNPVVLGRVRAKQDRFGDTERTRKLAILIHGDASFIGEGIVQETLNLSGLVPYFVGGTVHVVVNNQIGFTTPAEESRSTTYCTDVAKMLQIPIFHVNGEDPEAVAQVVQLAMDFRARFQRDVVIDMYCYRRHGHNEADEPAFTQPVLYRAIAQRKGVRDGYLEHLLKLGGVSREEADSIAVERREHLEQELSVARKGFEVKLDWLSGYWKPYVGGPESEVEDVDTGFDKRQLSELILKQTHIPADFEPHPKVHRLLQARKEMAEGTKLIDWGTAEAAAFASLLTSKVRVRMTGQDVPRGTFSHRHAVFYDVRDGRTYTPLAKLAQGQAPIHIYNSPLSESGVLGFEWGYSLDCPEGLVIWEAQFGDFCNVAQPIIDQFIVSAEDKWKRLSGLVMLLPHGFEGMGPEHSSARLERFLNLTAEDNIQVCQPTTPAQYFHMLRRQVLRPWRKPLVVFTPKSLLRLPEASSSLEQLADGRFERVLGDPIAAENKDKITRILLCTGKIYYDLCKHRQELARDDVAIVRVEQLYPLPKKALAGALNMYPAGTPVVWVQDEPLNMGAWTYIRMRFGKRLLGRYPVSVVAREASASPATGSASSHNIEQQELIDQAFAGS
ncbi:MAG TPA: 2-oxoglutarate dehydrogenase E1 component [Polyangiaceae bacterium]|jgi:2-oxoglutarate dehydrogenase E1 component|nr:2-oxoglutarate dehydrogenase E1 component [Polyangiaceae bacterium]